MRATVAGLLFVAACGGGGGGVDIPPPPSKRTDLLFGYYFGQASTFTETANHANLAWVRGGTVAEMMERIASARLAGQKVVLDLSHQGYGNEGAVRQALLALNVHGFLDGIVALYPEDEPDKRHGDAEIRAWNAVLRKVMADFPETLGGTKLAVIYGPDENYPGADSYDWVGFDDYGPGSGIFGGKFQRLKARLRPDQRLLLVPGGADPWKQDPAPFFNYAHTDPQVVAVIAFLWDGYTEKGIPYMGIRDNGMAKAYCAQRVTAC